MATPSVGGDQAHASAAGSFATQPSLRVLRSCIVRRCHPGTPLQQLLAAVVSVNHMKHSLHTREFSQHRRVAATRLCTGPGRHGSYLSACSPVATLIASSSSSSVLTCRARQGVHQLPVSKPYFGELSAQAACSPGRPMIACSHCRCSPRT